MREGILLGLRALTAAVPFVTLVTVLILMFAKTP